MIDVQTELAQAIVATGKPVVVVLIHAGAIAIGTLSRRMSQEISYHSDRAALCRVD